MANHSFLIRCNGSRREVCHFPNDGMHWAECGYFEPLPRHIWVFEGSGYEPEGLFTAEHFDRRRRERGSRSHSVDGNRGTNGERGAGATRNSAQGGGAALNAGSGARAPPHVNRGLSGVPPSESRGGAGRGGGSVRREANRGAYPRTAPAPAPTSGTGRRGHQTHSTAPADDANGRAPPAIIPGGSCGVGRGQIEDTRGDHKSKAPALGVGRGETRSGGNPGTRRGGGGSREPPGGSRGPPGGSRGPPPVARYGDQAPARPAISTKAPKISPVTEPRDRSADNETGVRARGKGQNASGPGPLVEFDNIMEDVRKINAEAGQTRVNPVLDFGNLMKEIEKVNREHGR